MLVDVMTVVQAANVVLQAVFIVIVGLGYYYSVRATRVMGQATQEMVQEMRDERTTGGRPLITTVSEDYESLPNLSLVVQNVGLGPAKSISFSSRRRSRARTASCSPIWPSSKGGLPTWRPAAKILCYWHKLENLLPMIQEGRLEREISVTV